MKINFRYKIFLTLLFVANISFSQRIAVIGDYRSNGPGTDSVSMLVKNWNPDFVLTTGDNFDLTSGTLDDQVGQYYSEFIFPYTGSYLPGGSVNTFFPCIGNHELNNSGLQGYYDYFTLPGNERYYQLVTGNVAVFIINSNSFEPDGVADTSVQAIWLRDNLSLSTAPWKIVVFHHPPFSSGPHGSDTTMQWPFRSWGADAVLSGHEHGYERLAEDSLVYFVNGAGGASLYSFGSIAGSQITYSKNYGAQLITAFPDSLIFQFFNIRDSLVDTCVLRKPIIPQAVNEFITVHQGITQSEIEIILSGFCSSKIDLKIITSEGRLIKEKNNIPISDHKLTVNIEGFKSGIYFIQLSGVSFKGTATFVVSR